VIQNYLEGKSMNQIAKETRISKGKVHYIIKGWKNKLGTSSTDKITEFAQAVNRSGITIKQCAQGFRMTNILKKLDIRYSDVIDDENHDEDNNNINELIFFIEEIYKL